MEITGWREVFIQTYESLSQRILENLPQILGALLVLLLGWGVARVLALSSRKLVHGLDLLFARFTRTELTGRNKFQGSYALIISKLVFWVVLFFFMAVSANILDWPLFSGWMDSLIRFLPGLVSGFVIILGGFLLASLARTGTSAAATRAGFMQAQLIGRLVQVAIAFSVIIIGVGQFGIDISFLSNVILLATGVLLAGAALAFGLGASTLVSNVVGTQHLSKFCKPGDRICLGGTSGEVEEIVSVGVVLRTATGRVMVPGRLFQEAATEIADSETQVHAKTREGGEA